MDINFTLQSIYKTELVELTLTPNFKSKIFLESIQSPAGNPASGAEGETSDQGAEAFDQGAEAFDQGAESFDQGAEAFDQGADEEMEVDQELQEPEVQEQVGAGPLPLNHTLNPPAGFNIVTESETFYPNLGIHGRKLENRP